MESRLQSNEIRIPKRPVSQTTASIITTNANSSFITSTSTTSNPTSGTTTSYLAINLSNSIVNPPTSSSSVALNGGISSNNLKISTASILKNQSSNKSIDTSSLTIKNCNNNNNMITKTAIKSSDTESLKSITSNTTSVNTILNSPPDFDLDTPCQYFKSSFARSLSLAGCAGIVGCGTNQTKSLDFGINFSISRASPITEETTQQLINCQNGISPITAVSSGLVFSSYDNSAQGNPNLKQQLNSQQRKMKTIVLNNTDNVDNNHKGTEIIYNGSNTNSPAKMKFLNGDANPTTSNNNNIWSNSTSSAAVPAATTATLRKQNFNRRSLDSSEIELLRLRKECQNLVEENRRLMGLASGMVRGNLIIPGNSSNIEAVILQTQVDTLQWQLKQVEASREMYRAVMEEVVRFLERCHRNLENLQNQQQQQQTTTINTRPRSIHQMTYRHNDILENDTNSILSNTITSAHHQQLITPPVVPVTVGTATISSSSSSSCSSASILNQSSLSAMFSNQNMSPRARTSTNLIDANKPSSMTVAGTTVSSSNKQNCSTIDVDNSSSCNNILIEDSSVSSANASTVINSHNNFRDFTWRRSPKRQQNSQLGASASRDIEKLAQEAFRLLRTAQNLLNTQEPDLTQSKTLNSDLSFLSNCSSSNNSSNGILNHNNHHHSTLSNGNGLPQSIAISSSASTLKSNSSTIVDNEPFLISSFTRKVNMRESRLSLRSSTDGSVHSTASTLSSKNETDEENNTALQQIQQHKIISNNVDSNKESPACSSTVSSSTTEDESGFSSISSFQEIGLPLHSTIISNSGMLLNNTNNSLISSNSDELSGNNKTIGNNSNNSAGGSNGESTLIYESRNSTLKSNLQQHNFPNEIGLPSSNVHRRWDSAPAVPPRNSLHRFSTVSNNGHEGSTVLWV